MMNWDLYCWRCFKDNPQDTFIALIKIRLCKGCGYEIRQMTNFLRAHGLVLVPSEPEGEEGVVKGQKGAENGKVKEEVAVPA